MRRCPFGHGPSGKYRLSSILANRGDVARDGDCMKRDSTWQCGLWFLMMIPYVPPFRVNSFDRGSNGSSRSEQSAVSKHDDPIFR